MSDSKLIITILASFVLLCSEAAFSADLVKQTDDHTLYAVSGEFEEISENVVTGVEDKGIVINNVAHVGEMLRRTGESLGETQHTYLHADVVEFCSATLSRKMAAADPTTLVFCPYAIHVYELVAEPGRIYVGFKRPLPIATEASRPALEEIDRLLADIVNAALDW